MVVKEVLVIRKVGEMVLNIVRNELVRRSVRIRVSIKIKNVLVLCIKFIMK